MQIGTFVRPALLATASLFAAHAALGQEAAPVATAEAAARFSSRKSALPSA